MVDYYRIINVFLVVQKNKEKVFEKIEDEVLKENGKEPTSDSRDLVWILFIIIVAIIVSFFSIQNIASIRIIFHLGVPVNKGILVNPLLKIIGIRVKERSNIGIKGKLLVENLANF